MKRNQSALMLLTTFVCLGVLLPHAYCQQATPLKAVKPQSVVTNIVWDGPFGESKNSPNEAYCLMGNGFFLAPTSANFKPLVSGWLAKHPKARTVRVEAFGPVMVDQPQSKQVYVWIIDGTGSLNEFLVRQGACPGSTMLIPDTSRYPAEANKSSHQKMFVSKQEYACFIKAIAKAESAAQKQKLGIWKNGTDID